MTELVEQFVESMDKIGGIRANGLPGNAFLLLPSAQPPAVRLPWPQGAWQVELLWQFLLHADRAGVELESIAVRTGGPAVGRTVTLAQLLVDCFNVHDRDLFNGRTYVIENGKLLTGRSSTAPINHAADTLRDLARNLAET